MTLETSADSGVGRRGFFDGTIPLRTVEFDLTDYTSDNNLTFLVKYATKTQEWHILNTKDLYIGINVTEVDAASSAEVFIADCYFEELVVGGEFGGISFYRDGLAIGDDTLMFVNETIPYHAHVLLPGLDVFAISDSYTPHRLDGGAYGTQISMEIQLFIKIGDKYYQDYLVDTFIINNGGSQATSYAPEVVTSTPGFEVISLFFATLTSYFIIKKLRKKKTTND
ncbi:MAG: hypothetical protein ACXADA_00775 [Candidatus Hodarchaeales archaeon]